MLCLRQIHFATAFLLLLVPVVNICPADAPPPRISPVDQPAGPRGTSSMLSRPKIFQAIEAELGRRGIYLGQSLRPGDLNIQATVPGLSGRDRGDLKVTRVHYDAIRRELVFEVWDAQEPQYLPFQVTTRRDPQSLGLTSVEGWESARSGAGTKDEIDGRPKQPIQTKAPVLAKPGTPATLVMLGQNVRITLTVVPLQPGSKGQTIRVRDLVTDRVLTAEVMDVGLLQASF